MTITDFLPDQRRIGAHDDLVGQEPNFPASQNPNVAQEWIAGGEQIPAGHAIELADPRRTTAVLLDPTLAIAADVLDDIERVRIANENRFRTLTTPFEDGGAGLTVNHPDIARLAAIVDTMGKLEHDATLQLQRVMRRHPLGPWVKSKKGVGEKQAARLLAAIGDPYINSATGQPRTVSALWAYSGLHVLPASQSVSGAQLELAGGEQTSDPGHSSFDTHVPAAGVAAKRQKGQKANWSSNAKMRAYLIAESCIKQAQSPYRAIYDARRTRTAVTHPDWTPGHSHNDALRVASKEILKDLWKAARDLHTEGKTS